jgi:phosphoribosylamine--glycine ligase
MEFDNMKILVAGSGGREHALCWKLSRSPLVTQLFCAPGNAGIAQIATCLQGDIVEIAQRIGADFVVVGPDGMLADGLIDRLQAAGIAAFGPTQEAAQLESSKIFCKELMRKYGIPSGGFHAFETPDKAREFLSTRDENEKLVVKADGLAVGKGVVVASTRDEAIAAVDEVLGIASATVKGASTRVVIEEFLEGEEVSLLALCDGENVLPLVPAQDHKRASDGDTGPNTGGMGCYSPVPVFTKALYAEAVATVLKPVVAALRAEGITFRGVLYAGLMLTKKGMRVLEFNARFGDPETQVVLPRLQSDLLPLLLACSGDERFREYSLMHLSCDWTSQAAVCVVMASRGYPGNYEKGAVLFGLDEAQKIGATIFHAGTALHDGDIVASGGRVLGVTALGENFHQARETAYAAVEKIGFDGAHFRRDIGARAMPLS